jgi:chloramphenicol 3-O phosphotransferase
MPSHGRIVLLNGPSSSGKTTLSQAVARRLTTPWLVLPVDLFHQIRTRPDAELSDRQWHDVFHRTRAAYHRALVGAAASGCDVLADHALSEPWRLDDLLGLSVGLDVLLVHVTCSPKELRRREQTRGDRDVGSALTQQRLVFQHGDCDLTVDTTYGPDEPTAALLELIRQPPTERAFDRLRAKRSVRA